MPQPGIRQRLDHGIGQCLGILRFHQQAGLFVFNELRDRRNPGCDHGNPHCHAFDADIGDAVPIAVGRNLAAQNKDIRLRVLPDDRLMGQGSRPTAKRFQAKIPHQFFKPVPLLPLSDQGVPERNSPRVQDSQGLIYGGESFFGGHAGDGQDAVRRRGRRTFLPAGEKADVDAVVKAKKCGSGSA